MWHFLAHYRNDRLNNSLFLSPSLCTNGLSYLGKETRPKLCINDAKLRSGILDLERNKHQLLHRIASVKTPPIYNNISAPHPPTVCHLPFLNHSLLLLFALKQI